MLPVLVHCILLPRNMAQLSRRNEKLCPLHVLLAISDLGDYVAKRDTSTDPGFDSDQGSMTAPDILGGSGPLGCGPGSRQGWSTGSRRDSPHRVDLHKRLDAMTSLAALICNAACLSECLRRRILRHGLPHCLQRRVGSLTPHL